MFLYHYYDKKIGPFMNLSELSMEQSNNILTSIKQEKPTSQSAQRDSEYMFSLKFLKDVYI